jgi:hypothetical protein
MCAFLLRRGFRLQYSSSAGQIRWYLGSRAVVALDTMALDENAIDGN